MSSLVYSSITRGLIALALAGLAFSSAMMGCTYTRMPSKIYASRTIDTLNVALDPLTSAEWEPAKDSIVLDCPTCAHGKSNIVEHLEDRSYAEFDIPATQTVNVTVYNHGRIDSSFVMTGIGTSDSTATFIRIPTHRRHREAPVVETPVTKPKEVPVVTPVKVATEVTKKKATTLHVVATEGVAVYKDKSKTEVLKILPQGSTLTLIAREGDLFSVALGDGEGFVEAEAVQIDQ